MKPRGTVLPSFWTVLLLAFLPASSASALTNLTPYLPSGWSDKIVVSKVTGTNTDSTSLTATDTLYLDWAVLNNGSTATAVRYHVEIYLDGALITSEYSDPPLNPNFYDYWEDASIGSLPAGTHTIRIKTDSTGVIAESNETDNEYTKTITVTGMGAPNLTPYQPSGWSDKIVVSRLTGTHTDSTSLTATDSLYMDWAVINSGSTATPVRYYTEIYLDGSLFYSWSSDLPLNPNFWSGWQDASIGSLPAGTHTIRIKTDSTGVIAETNEADNEYTKTVVITGAQACTPGQNQLCLNNNRFKVQVNWRVPAQGISGVGKAIPVTGGDTGYFWFFNNANVELMVKVLDGKGVNGHFWVFYGALSDVEYTLTVTDTATGLVKSYFNPQGRVASVADTSAFVSSTSPMASSLLTSPLQVEPHVPEQTRGSALVGSAAIAAGPGLSSGVSSPFAWRGKTANAAPCFPSTTALCLNGNRFSVEVTWRVPSQGMSGVGTAVPLTSDTGYFWFFNNANVELVIKILDGRGLNGKFWVFFGALSDVEYKITVTDTVTRDVRTYYNPSSLLASIADTAAFPPPPPPQVLETVSQTVRAAAGGTVRLPGASRVSLPPGMLAADQAVTLSLLSGLPEQPPSGLLQSVGSAISLSFSYSAKAASPLKASRTAEFAPWQGQSSSSDLEFTIDFSNSTAAGFDGSAPVVQIVIPSIGASYFAGARGTIDLLRRTATLTLPAEVLRTVLNDLSLGKDPVQLTVNAALTNVYPCGGPKLPAAVYLDAGSGTWQDLPPKATPPFFDCSKKTLVLVHGINSDVQTAFPKECVGGGSGIKTAGQYDQVVGFNYNWTQGVLQSGKEFAAFLNDLCPNGANIDIEAHSLGAVVSLAAAPLVSFNIGKIVSLGGPIMGTAAAQRSETLTTALAYIERKVPSPPCPITLSTIITGDFASDVKPNSPTLTKIREDFNNIRPAPEVILAAGTKQGVVPTPLLREIFKSACNDGVVNCSSADGTDSGLKNQKNASFDSNHVELQCSTEVISWVGSKIRPPSPPSPLPTIQVTPLSIDFGQTLPGVDPPPRQLIIRNTGPAQSTLNYTITPSASWVRLDGPIIPLASGESVVFSVLARSSSLPAGSHDATITVADPAATNRSQTIQVHAGSSSSCSYSINPTSQSFGSGGGSNSVTITAASGCAWSAASNTSWITVTSGSSGTGNGTVSYSVTANSGMSQRMGTMSIGNVTFTVSQAGSVTYTLSTSTAGTGSGAISPTGGSYASGTVVTLIATPNTGSTFSGWSGACTGTLTTCMVTMNANKSVTATFNSTGSAATITANPSSVSMTASSCYPSNCTVSQTIIITSSTPWTSSPPGFGSLGEGFVVSPNLGPAGSTSVTISYTSSIPQRANGFIRFRTTTSGVYVEVPVIVIVR